jgi:hypothetical protein
VTFLGSQAGLRAAGAPWWTICLLGTLGLAVVCLQIVFPQDSPDKVVWWSKHWRTRQRYRRRRRCQCQHKPPGHAAERRAEFYEVALRADCGCRDAVATVETPPVVRENEDL